MSRNEEEQIHRLNCYVENRPGVLARIVGLISGRGYNIQTLNVGPTERNRGDEPKDVTPP